MWKRWTLTLACKCKLYGSGKVPCDVGDIYPCEDHGDQKVLRVGYAAYR